MIESGTVEAALLGAVLHQLLIGRHGGLEHKHARVEAVRPSRVRGCGQLLALKQVVDVGDHLGGRRGGTDVLVTVTTWFTKMPQSKGSR